MVLLLCFENKSYTSQKSVIRTKDYIYHIVYVNKFITLDINLDSSEQWAFEQYNEFNNSQNVFKVFCKIRANISLHKN